MSDKNNITINPFGPNRLRFMLKEVFRKLNSGCRNLQHTESTVRSTEGLIQMLKTQSSKTDH